MARPTPWAAAYDANSRLTQVSYPSGFTASYAYNNLGYANQLHRCRDQPGATGPRTRWMPSSTSPQQTAGNGLVTTRSFDRHHRAG